MLENHFERVVASNIALATIQKAQETGSDVPNEARNAFMENADSYLPVIDTVSDLMRTAFKSDEVEEGLLRSSAADVVMGCFEIEPEHEIASRGLDAYIYRSAGTEEDIVDGAMQEMSEQELRVRELIVVIQAELTSQGEAKPSRALLEARTELIGFYDRFIKSIANRVMKNSQSVVVEFEDLYQEGAMHILASAEKFDVAKSVSKFISYFAPYMRARMKRHIITSGYRGARMPDAMASRLVRIDALNEARRSRKQSLLTNDEIAEILGINPELTPIGERNGNELNMRDYWLSWLLRQTGSLNTGFADRADGDISAGNGYVVENVKPVESMTLPTQEPVDELAFNKMSQDLVVKMLNVAELTQQERDVIILRFGIDSREPRTLEAVGYFYDLSREQIRQIEARAMSKLRHPQNDTGARDLIAS